MPGQKFHRWITPAIIVMTISGSVTGGECLLSAILLEPNDLPHGRFLQVEGAGGQGDREVVVFSLVAGIGGDDCFSHA